MEGRHQILQIPRPGKECLGCVSGLREAGAHSLIQFFMKPVSAAKSASAQQVQLTCCFAAAGAKGHHLAFSLQQMGSLGNNVAIQLSSALVMKARADITPVYRLRILAKFAPTPAV